MTEEINIEKTDPHTSTTSVSWGAREVIYGIIAMILFSAGMLLANQFLAFESNAVIVIYEAAYLLPAIAVLFLKRASWRELRLNRFPFSELLVGFALLFIAYMVIILHNLTLIYFDIAPQAEYMMQLFDMELNFWVLGIAVVVIAPISEEIFFRSFVYAGLVERFGWQKAVLISALIFGAAHMQLVAFLPTFLMGLVLAYLYERSQSVVPSIILHFSVNGFGFTMIYLLTTYGENLVF